MKSIHKRFRIFIIFEKKKMKNLFLTYLVMVVLLPTSCTPSLEKSVTELHEASEVLAAEMVPILQLLGEQSTRMQIQGRALSLKEIDFVQQVGQLQMDFPAWQQQFETVVPKMKKDQERLELETKLNNEIKVMMDRVKTLSNLIR